MAVLGSTSATGVASINSNSTTANPVINNSSGTQLGDFARMWVYFNGSGTVAVQKDFNINTVADNGVGLYTLTIANTLGSSNYALVGGGNAFSDAFYGYFAVAINSGTSCGVNYLRRTGEALVDAGYICLAAYI